MRRPALRSVFLLGILLGLLASLVRLLLRDARPAPAPLASPPPPLPATVAAPPVPVPVEVASAPREAAAPTSSPVAATPPPAPPAASTPAPADASADAPAATADRRAGSEPPSGADEPAWVAAVDGGCPEGYPIKAKVSSGIYHRPGGLSYERTRPDRCYPDVAAAEADGFRAAKR